MGYVNTMGINEIDYIIADPNLIKKDEENVFRKSFKNAQYMELSHGN